MSGELLSDGALLSLYERGDVQGWHVLVSRYIRRVYAVPRALGCTTALAGEITLTAFRRLNELLAAAQPVEDLSAWLMEAARDACASTDESLAEASNVAAFAPIAERLVRQDQVRQSLAALPMECQSLLAGLYSTAAASGRAEPGRRAGLSDAELSARRSACLRQLMEVVTPTRPTPRDSDAQADAGEEASCAVPFEQLVAYAEGELRGDALEQLAAHLRSNCPSCQEDLHRLEQVLGLIHTDRSTPPPDDLIAQVQALYPDPASRQTIPWTPLPGRSHRRRARGWILGVAVVLVLAVALLAAYAYWPSARTATVAQVAQGILRAKLGQGAPWTEARQGQILAQGARLQSEDAVSTVRFWDDSLLRIESSGEWALRSLQGSQNHRLVRIIVEQNAGQASYASAPPTRSASASLRIELPASTVDLRGTATLTVLPGGGAEAQVHEGSLRVLGEQGATDVTAGQRVTLLPGQLPVLSAAGRP